MAAAVLANRIRQAAALAACLWLGGQGKAGAVDYAPIPLACLLANSDAVAVVSLPAEAQGERYRVRATRVLRGTLKPGVLDVVEPAPWRGTPPRFETREALLFLRSRPGKVWEVLGPSGDGRVGLGATEADVRGLSLPAAVAVEGKIGREALLGALAAAADCFDFERVPKKATPRACCSAVRLEREKNRSALHRALLAQLEGAQGKGLACLF